MKESDETPTPPATINQRQKEAKAALVLASALAANLDSLLETWPPSMVFNIHETKKHLENARECHEYLLEIGS